jgi:processive 1,2-diacylglycerol beta-glucosyltransferase
MTAGRILIASASAGTGHMRAGDALNQAFRDVGAAVEHVDVLQLAPRWVRTAYAGGFELLASRAPRLWRELYRRSDGSDGDHTRWGGLAARLLFREFRALLVEGAFDACVCTHFLPAQLAAGRAGLPPFMTVITDFGVHRYWVQPGVRGYFVATRMMAEEVRRRQPGASLAVTGIPVDPAFAVPCDTAASRRSLHLTADRPVVLVMGGSFGLGVEAAARAALAARTPGLQVLVVCGRNEDARCRLAATAESEADARSLHVAGYIGEISQYMAAADVVVTKPGGLTTSEALALSRPLLLTRGIPGHEEANLRYLTGAGAALDASSAESLTGNIDRFFADAALRESLRASAARIAAPHAAPIIVQAVLDRMRHPAVA